MFKVSSASLQTFIDTPNCVLEDRVQYSTVLYFCEFFCTVIVRYTETLWSPCISHIDSLRSLNAAVCQQTQAVYQLSWTHHMRPSPLTFPFILCKKIISMMKKCYAWSYNEQENERIGKIKSSSWKILWSVNKTCLRDKAVVTSRLFI